MAKGQGKYKWATGGKTHSIPQATHEQNAMAQRTLGSLDLTAPPSAGQAVREANSAADLQYGPQVTQARQAAANVSPFYTDYLARVAGYAKAAMAQAAPVLQQAQGYQAGAAAQTAPGLDPGSAAGQQASQAAAGRQALGQLGLDALNTNATATQDYFGGQQAMAAREMPQAQQVAAQGLADAQSQRGAAVQGFLTTARQNAQNYAIARGGLGLDTAKAQADEADKSAQQAETNRHNTASETNAANRTAATQQSAADRSAAAGAKLNKYNVPTDQFEHWTTGHRQRFIDAFNEKHAAGADEKTAAEHATKVHAATGKVQNTITDIIGAWDGYVGTEVPDTTKPIMKNGQPVKGADGKPTYKQKKVSADDIKSYLGQDNKAWTAQLVHIALLRRAKKPLDQASIDYLRNLDPNFRIPREWLPYDPNIRPGSASDPKGGQGANK